MFNTNTGLSPADVMALGNGNDGWGNGGILWFLIILFALFNGGWGNGYGNGAGASENYVLTSDFAQLSRQMDMGFDGLRQQSTQIANGICSLGYDQLAQFNNINTNVLQSANATQNAINNCCCTNREGFSTVNYNMATQANGITNALNTGFCQTNFNAQSNTRDIVDSQNASTQAILAKLNAMEASAKDEKIAELTAMNSDLRFQASQVAQNQYLVGQLRPSPVPAYTVANPYCNCGCNAIAGYYGTTIG